MPFVASAEKRPVLTLVLLCLALYLPGFFTLPTLDRDEARFAQATVQMHESGDYIVPHFQDDLRAKKPVAIYWLQAATSGTAATLGFTGTSGHPGIWAFRIPSLLAAIIVVLLTRQIAARFYGARAGLIAGALVAGCVVLVAEANIAKTDAALAASIVAAQLALARAWLARDPSRLDPGLGNAALFWLAMAVGILLKGPIAPMVSGLTIAVLVGTSRDYKWLFLLRPVRGMALLLLAVLPWAVAAWIDTDGAFFGEAVGGDLLPKLAGGQERHGAPFGYYTALLALTFFPANMLLLPAIAKAWGARRGDAVMFLAAWIIPNWLVFELVPTKLPHYILPLYPALAILTAGFIIGCFADPAQLKARLARVSMGIWALVAAVLAVVMIALPALLPDGTAVEPGPWPVVGAVIFAALAVQALVMGWRGRPADMIVALAAVAVAFSIGLLEFSRPRVEPLWVADHIAATLKDRELLAGRVVSAGFSEPSLIFALGTNTLLTNGALAAASLADGTVDTALIEAREAKSFASAALALGLETYEVGRVSGLNYSRGDAVTVTIYQRVVPAL